MGSRSWGRCRPHTAGELDDLWKPSEHTIQHPDHVRVAIDELQSLDHLSGARLLRRAGLHPAQWRRPLCAPHPQHPPAFQACDDSTAEDEEWAEKECADPQPDVDARDRES